MDSTELTTNHSSYGRACINCARTKCKCITREGEVRCERCHRLNKECRPSTAVRRRNLKKPVVSKTNQLEEKIDGLMSMFRAQPVTNLAGHVQMNAAILDPEFQGRITLCSNTKSTSPARDSNTSNAPASTQAPSTPGTSGFGSASSPADTFAYHYEPTPQEAEQNLHTFTTKQLKYFPFIFFPDNTTAERLRQEHPFLWLCIMVTSSRVIAQQQALSKQIRDIIAQRLIYESQCSLDLLLGLLVFIGWSNLQTYPKPNLSLYAQLAEAMVFDLNLNKPKARSDKLVLCIYSQTYYKPSPRSMEERRAVLGCFLITSIISSFVRKIDALRWTPHMDECLRVLSANPECTNDETLIRQVQLQLIVEKVGHLQEETGEFTEYPKDFPNFYLQALNLQHQEIDTQISIYSPPNEVLIAHIHSTKLAIHEIALSPLFLTANTNNSDIQQMEFLYLCLNSVKHWFDVFFAIPPGDYIGFPYSIFSQLSHCLIILYKLSSLEYPSWVKAEVRKSADIISILDMVINNLAQVSVLAGLESGDLAEDVFTRTAKKFRSVKIGWEAKLETDIAMGNSVTQSTVDVTPYDFSMEIPANEWADDWLKDILTSMTT